MVYSLNIVDPGVAIEIDGDFQKVKAVDETWDGGDLTPTQYGGRAVRTDQIPTRMKWVGGRGKKMPDFDFSGSHVSVSEKAKNLIEQFEPNAHQFVPVDYYKGKGKGKYFVSRYILYACNRIDSMDHGTTTFLLYTIFVLPEYVKPGREFLQTWVTASNLVRWGEADLIPDHIPHDAPATYVFNRAQIGEHHLWCDKFGAGGLWLSDDLAHAIRAAGLTGVNLDDDVSKFATV